MFDFEGIHATTKGEQLRAWCIEKAIDSFSMTMSDVAVKLRDHDLIERAKLIEDYVREGV